MARIRFHLGAGENYKKWQIREGENFEFYNPSEVHIVMSGCKLVNLEKIAKKINEGQKKRSVCVD